MDDGSWLMGKALDQRTDEPWTDEPSTINHFPHATSRPRPDPARARLVDRVRRGADGDPAGLFVLPARRVRTGHLSVHVRQLQGHAHPVLPADLHPLPVVRWPDD